LGNDYTAPPRIDKAVLKTMLDYARREEFTPPRFA